MKKDLLTISDLERKDIEKIFRRSEIIEKKFKSGQVHHALSGKTLGLIFNKASTRTRISFESGMIQLGGNPLFLSSKDLQMDRGESIKDSAKIFSMYLDGIVIRTFSQNDVEELAENASIPVINGLTDLHHPCQIIADLHTIKKYLKTLQGVKIVYIGDGNNIVNSLMEGCAIFGMHLTISSPKGYEPDSSILSQAQKTALQNGGNISLISDPVSAVVNANILYTDVWTSMGQENERIKREKAFKKYQINSSLLKLADKNALVMHCLPAHRGEEITSEIIDGKQSIVFEQAENRLHIQKAILELLLGNR